MQNLSETVSYDSLSLQTQHAIFFIFLICDLSLITKFQSFISEMYTTPKVLYILELMRASFASDKPSHVTKIMLVLFSKFELNNRFLIRNLYLNFLYISNLLNIIRIKTQPRSDSFVGN